MGNYNTLLKAWPIHTPGSLVSEKEKGNKVLVVQPVVVGRMLKSAGDHDYDDDVRGRENVF